MINTYVINLDSQKERFKWMQTQLSEQGISFERFSAINPDQLSEPWTTFWHDARRSALSKGEIGCMLSHIMIWKSLLDSEAQFALVLEDDVHTQPDLASFLNSIPDLISAEEKCIHRLETFGARVTMQRAEAYRIGQRCGNRLLTNHGGTAAYIVNRATAEALFSSIEKFCNAIDIEMFDPTRRSLKDVDVIQWNPAPCIQDMILNGHRTQFKSVIHDQRTDERIEAEEREFAVVKQLKNTFRPVFTLAYDLAVWPKGKTRKLIKFG